MVTLFLSLMFTQNQISKSGRFFIDWFIILISLITNHRLPFSVCFCGPHFLCWNLIFRKINYSPFGFSYSMPSNKQALAFKIDLLLLIPTDSIKSSMEYCIVENACIEVIRAYTRSWLKILFFPKIILSS